MNHNIASSNFTITSLVKKSQKSLKVESWPLKSKIKGCQIIWSKVTCFVKVVKYRGVFAVTNFNIDVKWGVLRNIWSWAISEEFCVKGRLRVWFKFESKFEVTLIFQWLCKLEKWNDWQWHCQLRSSNFCSFSCLAAFCTMYCLNYVIVARKINFPR